METTVPPTGGPTGSATGAATAPIRRLTRDPSDRILGGVAGGLGRYFGIDAVIFRIAFVALAVIGGSGLALYLIGWLLIPEEGAERSIVSDVLAGGERRRPVFRLLVVALLVVAFLNLAVAGPWWGGPVRGPGVGVAALALGALLLVLVTRRAAVGWILGSAFAAVVVVAALAAGSALLIVSNNDVPMRGGVGDRSWHPAAAADVRPVYRLGVGDMTVDLSEVSFGEGVTHIDATVGIGHLLVEVPAGTAVTVNARSGAGEAVVFGDRDSGLGADRSRSLPARGEGSSSGGSSGGRLVIDAKTGVGQVEVVRVG